MGELKLAGKLKDSLLEQEWKENPLDRSIKRAGGGETKNMVKPVTASAGGKEGEEAENHWRHVTKTK